MVLKENPLPDWMQSDTEPDLIIVSDPPPEPLKTSDTFPKVVIVMAKCCQNKEPFGIRFEEREPDVWEGTWAFSINKSNVRQEVYDIQSINGSFSFSPEYPGCPYCKSMSAVLCNECKGITCHNGKKRIVKCPNCNSWGIWIQENPKNLKGIADGR
jgi:hypothetical protein